MPEQIMKTMWNQRAQKDAFYYVESAFWDGNIDRFFELGEERTKEILEPIIQKLSLHTDKLTLLEIGCGVGRFSREFSKRFNDVVAVDVSDEMVTQATTLNPTARYPNLSFHATDGSSLDFIDSNSIDFVFSYEVFQHMPSSEIVLANLKEVQRVLKPKGHAYIHLMTSEGSIKKEVKKLAKKLVPGKVWQAFGFSPLTFDSTWTGTSLTKKQIQQFCDMAGLQIISLVNDLSHESGDRVFLLASPK